MRSAVFLSILRCRATGTRYRRTTLLRMGDVSHRDTEHEGSGHCAADSRNEGQGGSVKNPWTMKMEQFTRFSEEERRKLDELVSQRNKTFGPGEDILREGDHSPDCHVILSGLA